MKRLLALFITLSMVTINISAYALDYTSTKLNFKQSIVGSEMDGKTVYFYPQGFNRSINVKNDMSVLGQNLHLYFMGTSSDFTLKYFGDGNYIIDANVGGLSYVVEAPKHSKKENDKLRVWANKKGKRQSQLWKFYKNEDGSLQIQNSFSGLYMSLDKDGLDKDKNIIVQSKNPVNWEVICYDNEFADPWMKKINDNKLLSEINIPGTHDTGSRLVDGCSEQITQSQCQYLSPAEQLAAGVRMFDLRCTVNGFGKDPLITHGTACYDKPMNYMYLSEIFDQAEAFLAKYPSECVVFLISIGDTVSSSSKAKKLENVIANYINKGRIWSGTDVPKLKDVRGKIVLMRRFNITGDNQYKVGEDQFGFNLAAWEENVDYSSVKQAIPLKRGTHAWIQDNFQCSGKEKYKYFEPTLRQAENFDKIPVNEFVFNYSSCRFSNPFFAARSMNKKMSKNNLFKHGRRVGFIVMDYVTLPLARLVYESNW